MSFIPPPDIPHPPPAVPTEDRKFFLYRPPADIHLHNRCWASAYQLLCKRTTAVVRLKT